MMFDFPIRLREVCFYSLTTSAKIVFLLFFNRIYCQRDFFNFFRHILTSLGIYHFERRSKMTQVEKLIKIIMPDILRYLEMQESGEIIQKRLDKIKNPSIHCDHENENNGGTQ